MVLAMGLLCWLVLGKCWNRTDAPRSGTVVLLQDSWEPVVRAFREHAENMRP